MVKHAEQCLVLRPIHSDVSPKDDIICQRKILVIGVEPDGRGKRAPFARTKTENSQANPVGPFLGIQTDLHRPLQQSHKPVKGVDLDFLFEVGVFPAGCCT